MRPECKQNEDQQKEIRVDVSSGVDVTDGGTRLAFGMLLNLSRNGFAFRTTGQIELDTLYKFHIHGIGVYNGKAIHCIENGTFRVEFESTESERARIDEFLGEVLNRRPHEFE